MNWISVKDRLPEIPPDKNKDGYVQIQVLVWCKKGKLCAWYQPDGEKFYDTHGWFGEEVENVTHWAELPPPPKED